MPRETYAAARTVSPRVHAYFERRRAETDSYSQEHLASIPEAETIEAVIDVAFWASLRREEGYMPRISLAFLSPEQARAAAVIRASPCRLIRRYSHEWHRQWSRPGIHLGVWRNGNGLCVWGTSRAIPKLCFVLEVAAPGLLVVKHHSGEEAGKFVNVAVVEGDQIKVVDEHALKAPRLPRATDIVDGIRLTDVVGSFGQRTGATGRLHARARARWRSIGGASRP